MNQDFRELLETFNSEKVRYLVVGGYAVIKHTEPRYTKDLDVWVSPDRENAERVYAALQKFGAPLTGLSPDDFSEKGFFYTMGIAPQRVGVLFDIKGLEFEPCWMNRVGADIGGLIVNFISAEDLIINKEAVGRYQDLADVEKLRVAQQRIQR
ncbi:MAG TPA: DUF6036 family nucleotidyltransferase [Pyrinomonadaceae bacterium]|nr:DUF6036 family nucleotidyltransferase [Pyrinomonadaceae bacterium]